MEIIFFKSKEHPDYYLVYRGANGTDAERQLRKLTHVGEYENSGFPKIEIELGYILKTDLKEAFFDFLIEHISTNHIAEPFYDQGTFRAWYEFKNYTPNKWLEEFSAFQNSKAKESIKNNQQGIQTTLF